MMRSGNNRLLLPGGLVLSVCALGAGCSSRTYISATGSTPPQFTHVYITTQSVWLNANANAAPTDGGWQQFPLSTPVTIDLVAASNGTLEQISGDMSLAPGTYKSVELIPVPYSSVASTAAQEAGATYNQEVDFVDSSGNAHQVPLQIPNPATGIYIPGSLNVPFESLSSTSSSSTGTTTTGTSTSGLTSSSGSNVTFVLGFNAATDIALFTYGTAGSDGPNYGAVISSHAQAYDLSTAGGISGSIAVTTPNSYTNVSARLNITATAESLSTDGTRHVAVLSAPVNADGSFLLYPLWASSDPNTITTYDVVIHGAGIETMVITGVQVTQSGTGAASTATTTTTTTTVASANTSLGSLVPVTANIFTANVTGTTVNQPPGSAIGFYQTLNTANAVPYLIETTAVDPINNTFALPLALSAGNIESGAYSTAGTTTTAAATGQTLTLTSAAPAEGTGNYQVVPLGGPGYGEAPLGTMVNGLSAATATGSGTAVTVTPPALPLDPASTADTLSVNLTVSSSAIQYDSGVLLVSNGGTLIASTPLNSVLPQGGTVTLSNVPGGSASTPYPYGASYQLSALLWQAADPTTLTLESFATGANLANGSVTDAQVTIN
jgi:hypothetical protein